MSEVVTVEGPLLAPVLAVECALWPDGLDRRLHGRLDAALGKTSWGRRSRRRVALTDGTDLRASAVLHDLTGRLDGRALRIVGIGTLTVNAPHGRIGHAAALVKTLVDQSTRSGVDLALLFPRDNVGEDAREGFTSIPLAEMTLHVQEPLRYGAPMTMVRGGEERDLPAIVAMGAVRADGCRFHLDRDVDFVQHAMTKKRLLAGLGRPGERELHYFIAEEGTTAAAYVVVSVIGETWTIEECGDRDPSGARVGALLQALIARAPSERRPTIRGYLPPRFVPPQVTIIATTPADTRICAAWIGSGAPRPPLAHDDILFWAGDIF